VAVVADGAHPAAAEVLEHQALEEVVNVRGLEGKINVGGAVHVALALEIADPRAEEDHLPDGKRSRGLGGSEPVGGILCLGLAGAWPAEKCRDHEAGGQSE
jgi:hypothetical protein